MNIGHIAGTIYNLHQTNQPVQGPSLENPDLTEEEAYLVQAECVGFKGADGDSTVGYKAALTGRAAQKAMGLTEPIFGTLLDSMILESGAEVDGSQLSGLLIEVEIALYLGQEVTSPLNSRDEAKAVAIEAAPAFELPRMRLADPSTIKAVDLIADNVGATLVVTGQKQPITSLADLNQVQAAFFKNNRQINLGLAKETLANQYDALFWLINKVLAQGRILEKGQILLTGALCGMLPAEPGFYRADYGELGNIDFSLK